MHNSRFRVEVLQFFVNLVAFVLLGFVLAAFEGFKGLGYVMKARMGGDEFSLQASTRGLGVSRLGC